MHAGKLNLIYGGSLIYEIFNLVRYTIVSFVIGSLPFMDGFLTVNCGGI